jgi:hypothetical protein
MENCVNKKINKKKKLINVINNSRARKITNCIREKLNITDYVFGSYYYLLHYTFMILITIIFIFTNNITFLVILLNIILLDAASVVVLHDCPLSILEKKYLGISCVENRLYHMKNYNIMYTNSKVYDSTLDNLINAWSLVAIKILLLIIVKVFTVSKESSFN